ncbi:LpxL/LpxP family acyltransferase [Catalinimonas niigatensis]|uniref:LpxL/LpxP family acyltransferase n=1 Tax=Catalinimonas niigatensis TaxID=1397264 RepID=UPI0026670A72|nr:lipid A biosynthesis acyltransferase [Catalinimonas niigatensis]WPP48759.1 lipid A biosynthesis acyltransferase [Catalinimonas niigatensis]
MSSQKQPPKKGASWKGKTRGGLLGYQIFIFVLKRLGLKVAYLLLRIVAAYFVLFAPLATRSIYHYFRQILKYNRWKSSKSVYCNFYRFGQTLLDKIAIISGMDSSFSYTFDGKHHLQELSDSHQGGILISAHLGNWEIAGFFLKDVNLKVNIVMLEAEHEKIKNYLGQVMHNQNVHVIPIKEDLSHIFLINKALRNKEVICMHGDRFVEGSRVAPMQFMGKKAFFPLGPFTMAAKLNVPYTFVYAVKSNDHHYYLSATPLQHDKKKPMEILQDYIDILENKVKQSPLQWFNYYDFWSENLRGGIFEKQEHEKVANETGR